MQPELIDYIVTLPIANRLPALLNTLKEWQKVDPTMTDLKALKNLPIDPDAPEEPAWESPSCFMRPLNSEELAAQNGARGTDKTATWASKYHWIAGGYKSSGWSPNGRKA